MRQAARFTNELTAEETKKRLGQTRPDPIHKVKS